jgi:hypothetical protein
MFFADRFCLDSHQGGTAPEKHDRRGRHTKMKDNGTIEGNAKHEQDHFSNDGRKLESHCNQEGLQVLVSPIILNY